MNKRRSLSLSEAKIQASLLLKSLRGAEAKKTAKRLQRLPEFAHLSIEDILHQDIKRKHALAVIALENGFSSWADLKIQIHFIIGGHLNLWFANYVDAKTHLNTTGGYLLPFKQQFFICDAHYIKQIGFDPDDPDWRLISYDWANPVDYSAWQRLYKKWMAMKGGLHE